jgi:CheY-like chemotaxis protein
MVEDKERSPEPSDGVATSPAVHSAIEGLSILLVEDEDDTRSLIALTLEEAGARVAAVADMADALEALEARRWDLILSDIGMPHHDGYELIRTIRRTRGTSRTPAVALTAHATSLDRDRALAAGFDEHVAKPIDPVDLVPILVRVYSSAARASKLAASAADSSGAG